ncbi:uncharacterized protein TRUGW13939_08548 [Talaromyces rugulosus]|uniref:ABC transmembrane type-1 domain-containing protein n=1 Tax=Talaromyces rugulosus TaxID=121627 RepID=A0A7H8R4X0_TALRU|nr:uncharacterized protein TRUGW13939_08548 [Talaromyces rugulosus]QKX61400.1 hypothetical protein TRUGW13939_08548 [Talaromyces rugulosus]
MVLPAEAVEKRGLLLEPYRGLAPEETSGIYSKSFFFWLNQLVISGFRRVLRNCDLYPIDGDMSSSVLRRRMKNAWSAATRDKKRALFWTVLQANVKPLLFCIVPRLLQMGFRYTQPLLLTRTIAFTNDENQPNSIGWGLAGAFFIVLLGVAVSNGIFYHMTFRFVTSIRGSLIGLIYSKTVNLSVTALDESVAVTLMSSDVQSICTGFQLINDLWGVPLALAIVIYLLTQQLGIAALMPAALVFISTVAIVCMAKVMAHAQKIWMKGIQTRVDVTATMLGSMKSVKMLGFTDWLADIVQGLRISELQDARLYPPALTFAIFTKMPQKGHSLTFDLVYTTLSLISLLASPINTFIRAIPAMNTALGSFDRIQEFLQSDGRCDHRIIWEDSAAKTPEVQSRSGGFELSDLTHLKQKPASAVISARDKGQFLFIIGPTACGKSTLMKGILGETPSTKGLLYTSYRDAAFVDQTPWIRNMSFRDNILGCENYFETWYQEVVSPCGLDQDVANLPYGHSLMLWKESQARENGDFGLYLYYLGSVHWASSAFWMTFFILEGIVPKLSELLVKIWMSSLEKQGSAVNSFYLGVYALVSTMAALALVIGAHHLFMFFAPRSAENLHQRLLSSVIHAPLSVFPSVDTGTTMNSAVLGGILMILVVKLRNEVGTGYAGLAILNIITFSQSLSQILRNWAELETSIGAIAQIRDFVTNTASDDKPGEERELLAI